MRLSNERAFATSEIQTVEQTEYAVGQCLSSFQVEAVKLEKTLIDAEICNRIRSFTHEKLNISHYKNDLLMM